MKLRKALLFPLFFCLFLAFTPITVNASPSWYGPQSVDSSYAVTNPTNLLLNDSSIALFTASNSYVILDFGQIFNTVTAIYMQAGYYGDSYSMFKFEISLDKNTWATVGQLHMEYSSYALKWGNLDYAHRSLRYVKISFYQYIAEIPIDYVAIQTDVSRVYNDSSYYYGSTCIAYSYHFQTSITEFFGDGVGKDDVQWTYQTLYTVDFLQSITITSVDFKVGQSGSGDLTRFWVSDDNLNWVLIGNLSGAHTPAIWQNFSYSGQIRYAKVTSVSGVFWIDSIRAGPVGLSPPPPSYQINLLEIPTNLAALLGIPVFAAGILLSCILLALFLFPTIIITKAKSRIAVVFVGFGVFCFCLALGWFPVFSLILLLLIIVLMYGKNIKDLFT